MEFYNQQQFPESRESSYLSLFDIKRGDRVMIDRVEGADETMDQRILEVVSFPPEKRGAFVLSIEKLDFSTSVVFLLLDSDVTFPMSYAAHQYSNQLNMPDSLANNLVAINSNDIKRRLFMRHGRITSGSCFVCCSVGTCLKVDRFASFLQLCGSGHLVCPQHFIPRDVGAKDYFARELVNCMAGAGVTSVPALPARVLYCCFATENRGNGHFDAGKLINRAAKYDEFNCPFCQFSINHKKERVIILPELERQLAYFGLISGVSVPSSSSRDSGLEQSAVKKLRTDLNYAPSDGSPSASKSGNMRAMQPHRFETPDRPQRLSNTLPESSQQEMVAKRAISQALQRVEGLACVTGLPDRNRGIIMKHAETALLRGKNIEDIEKVLSEQNAADLLTMDFDLFIDLIRLKESERPAASSSNFNGSHPHSNGHLTQQRSSEKGLRAIPQGKPLNILVERPDEFFKGRLEIIVNTESSYDEVLETACDALDCGGDAVTSMMLVKLEQSGWNRKIEYETLVLDVHGLWGIFKEGDVAQIRKITTAFLGGRYPLSILANMDKHNQSLQKKVLGMADNFEGYLEIRGDGNCYYRAVLVGILELAILDDNRHECFQDIVEVFNRVTFADDEDAWKISHEGLMSVLTSARDNERWRSVKEMEGDLLNESTGLDAALIVAAKKLVTAFLKANQETEWNGLSMNVAIMSTNEQYKDFDEYCEDQVMKMGECAEGPHVDIGILPMLLNCYAEIVMLDRNENVPLIKKGGWEEGMDKRRYEVYVLFRPGHYDLLYKHGMVGRIMQAEPYVPVFKALVKSSSSHSNENINTTSRRNSNLGHDDSRNSPMLSPKFNDSQQLRPSSLRMNQTGSIPEVNANMTDREREFYAALQEAQTRDPMLTVQKVIDRSKVLFNMELKIPLIFEAWFRFKPKNEDEWLSSYFTVEEGHNAEVVATSLPVPPPRPISQSSKVPSRAPTPTDNLDLAPHNQTPQVRKPSLPPQPPAPSSSPSTDPTNTTTQSSPNQPKSAPTMTKTLHSKSGYFDNWLQHGDKNSEDAWLQPIEDSVPAAMKEKARNSAKMVLKDGKFSTKQILDAICHGKKYNYMSIVDHCELSATTNARRSSEAGSLSRNSSLGSLASLDKPATDNLLPSRNNGNDNGKSDPALSANSGVLLPPPPPSAAELKTTTVKPAPVAAKVDPTQAILDDNHLTGAEERQILSIRKDVGEERWHQTLRAVIQVYVAGDYDLDSVLEAATVGGCSDVAAIERFCKSKVEATRKDGNQRLSVASPVVAATATPSPETSSSVGSTKKEELQVETDNAALPNDTPSPPPSTGSASGKSTAERYAEIAQSMRKSPIVRSASPQKGGFASDKANGVLPSTVNPLLLAKRSGSATPSTSSPTIKTDAAAAKDSTPSVTVSGNCARLSAKPPSTSLASTVPQRTSNFSATKVTAPAGKLTQADLCHISDKFNLSKLYALFVQLTTIFQLTNDQAIDPIVNYGCFNVRSALRCMRFGEKGEIVRKAALAPAGDNEMDDLVAIEVFEKGTAHDYDRTFLIDVIAHDNVCFFSELTKYKQKGTVQQPRATKRSPMANAAPQPPFVGALLLPSGGSISSASASAGGSKGSSKKPPVPSPTSRSQSANRARVNNASSTPPPIVIATTTVAPQPPTTVTTSPTRSASANRASIGNRSGLERTLSTTNNAPVASGSSVSSSSGAKASPVPAPPSPAVSSPARRPSSTSANATSGGLGLRKQASLSTKTLTPVTTPVQNTTSATTTPTGTPGSASVPSRRYGSSIKITRQSSIKAMPPPSSSNAAADGADSSNNTATPITPVLTGVSTLTISNTTTVPAAPAAPAATTGPLMKPALDKERAERWRLTREDTVQRMGRVEIQEWLKYHGLWEDNLQKVGVFELRDRLIKFRRSKASFTAKR